VPPSGFRFFEKKCLQVKGLYVKISAGTGLEKQDNEKSDLFLKRSNIQL